MPPKPLLYMVVLIASMVSLMYTLISLQINDLAKWLAQEMNSIAYSCLYEKGPIFDKYQELRKKHSTPEKPFLFQVIYTATLAISTITIHKLAS